MNTIDPSSRTSYRSNYWQFGVLNSKYQSKTGSQKLREAGKHRRVSFDDSTTKSRTSFLEAFKPKHSNSRPSFTVNIFASLSV